MMYYPDISNLAQVSAIYSTFKNYNKKMGSPCLSSHCVLVTVMSVFAALRTKCSKLKQPSKILIL